jgi:hypothetical protein
MALRDNRALRFLLAIGAGALAWHLVLGASMGILRLLWPAYDAAYPERDYTLAMLWIRLAVFSVTVIATSTTAVLVGRDERLAWFAGLAILGFSIPPHFYPGSVWSEYPPWYHYTYLLSIVPLAVASRPIRRRWVTRLSRPAAA